ncbi:MAG: ADP-heptose--LPS heptosyltransferase, partial [Campylobacter sp.]|nr:ADP-heptose--LPS heptosyltransferase [Campylobacter sp.]
DKENSRILRLNLPCSPCMKRVCPLGHHACMDKLTAPMALAKLSELGIKPS